MYRTVFWTLWERARVEWYGRMALKHVNYNMWSESPVQVQCMIQGTQGWCTGMTQRDGMGREVGAGSGWGTHVNPSLIHVIVWQKPLQYSKVISLQLIKIIGEKKNKKEGSYKGSHMLWFHWHEMSRKGPSAESRSGSRFPQAGKIRKGKLAQDDCKKL